MQPLLICQGELESSAVIGVVSTQIQVHVNSGGLGFRVWRPGLDPKP